MCCRFFGRRFFGSHAVSAIRTPGLSILGAVNRSGVARFAGVAFLVAA